VKSSEQLLGFKSSVGDDEDNATEADQVSSGWNSADEVHHVAQSHLVLRAEDEGCVAATNRVDEERVSYLPDDRALQRELAQDHRTVHDGVLVPSRNLSEADDITRRQKPGEVLQHFRRQKIEVGLRSVLFVL